MNVLAYLSGVFALSALAVPSPLNLYLAVLAALCGLLSTVLFHQSLIRSALDSFFAKFFAVCIAAITVILAPSISDGVIANLTLLNPKKFPDATSALSALIVACMWASIAYVILMAAIWVQAMHAYRASATPQFRKKIRHYLNSKVLSASGRIAGLCMLLFYLTPSAVNYTGDNIGVELERLLLASSFMDNVEQFSWYAVSPERHPPKGCKEAAIAAGADGTRAYGCRVATRHCSNVSDRARIAYYSDTEVVVATELDRHDPLFELVPMRFEVQRCEIDGRYLIDVRQRPSEPGIR